MPNYKYVQLIGKEGVVDEDALEEECKQEEKTEKDSFYSDK